MRITIFGGASPKPGDTAYEEAFQLGCMLGKAGHTVLTGGYIGTMEAVSKGTNESGGHVIGITCEEIERWRPIRMNQWVQAELRFPTLRERLFALLDQCDAAMALPGGVGTLAETSVLWNHLIISAYPPKLLILIGTGWRKVISGFLSDLGSYVPKHDQTLVQFAQDNLEAMEMLNHKK